MITSAFEKMTVEVLLKMLNVRHFVLALAALKVNTIVAPHYIKSNLESC